MDGQPFNGSKYKIKTEKDSDALFQCVRMDSPLICS
jgi:hypothetical protein